VIVTADLLGRQLAAIFRGWGMSEEHIAVTVEVMLGADLSAIDSHGVAMMPLYGQLRAAAKLDLQPEIRVVRETATAAVIDGGGGLGHVPATRAMQLAIAKARQVGMAIATVRNSNHFGAAGIYALMAAEAGLIGLAMTNVHNASVVPTFAADPMFGTNPIAFAAPTRRNKPYLFDMATSTAAIGKLKIANMAGKPVPEGWALNPEGEPLTDAAEALKYRRLTPLGGSRELGGHKGYGLAMMVEILSATLGGAAFAPLRAPDATRLNVGHFLMAIDPTQFREDDAFETDLDDMIDALRATRPVDPEQKVIVAGDPEHEAKERRRRDGIPVPEILVRELEAMATECRAEILL
jgi:LDH2 family malate/lactate/ureidoglycolate dehydrogenase